MEIRTTNDDAELRQVCRIAHDSYVAQGYCPPSPDGLLNRYPQFDHIEKTTVFVAMEDRRVVGTLSLTRDGPLGLPVDDDFKAECDAIRREGCRGDRLFSVWRLATCDSCRNARHVVMGLFSETYYFLLDHCILTGVFTFNPRHEEFYRRVWNMKAIGHKDGSVNGLQNAPAVLMRFDADTAPDKWMRTPADWTKRDNMRLARRRLSPDGHG